MKSLHGIAFILVIIGAFNWGLIALGAWMGQSWNVVSLLLGRLAPLDSIVYLLIGVSAIVLVTSHKKDCRYCNPSGMM